MEIFILQINALDRIAYKRPNQNAYVNCNTQFLGGTGWCLKTNIWNRGLISSYRLDSGRVRQDTIPCKVRTSCSMSLARWKIFRMFRTMMGRFSATCRNPQTSRAASRRSKKLTSSPFVAGFVRPSGSRMSGV